MSSMLMFCAALLGGSGLTTPDFWGVSQQQVYQVEVKWVEKDEAGRTFVVAAPWVTVPADQTIHIRRSTSQQGTNRNLIRDEEQCSDPRLRGRDPMPTRTPGENTFQQIRLNTLPNGNVRMDLLVSKWDLERAVRQGTMAQGVAFSIQQQVQPGRNHQVVLRRNQHGDPTTWIEVRIRSTAQEAQLNDAEEEEPLDLSNTIRPFHYHPY